MKLKDYLKFFEGVDGDLDVIYAIDDEGNAFHPVVYSPTIGHFDGHDFMGKDGDHGKPTNAICIN